MEDNSVVRDGHTVTSSWQIRQATFLSVSLLTLLTSSTSHWANHFACLIILFDWYHDRMLFMRDSSPSSWLLPTAKQERDNDCNRDAKIPFLIEFPVISNKSYVNGTLTELTFKRLTNEQCCMYWRISLPLNTISVMTAKLQNQNNKLSTLENKPSTRLLYPANAPTDISWKVKMVGISIEHRYQTVRVLLKSSVGTKMTENVERNMYCEIHERK